MSKYHIVRDLMARLIYHKKNVGLKLISMGSKCKFAPKEVAS